MKTNILLLLLLSITCLSCIDKPKQFDINVDYNNELLIMIPVKIGDTTIMMLWDTGCSNTAISEELAEKLSIEVNTDKKQGTVMFNRQFTNKVASYFEFTIKEVSVSKPVLLGIDGSDFFTTSEMSIIPDLLKDSLDKESYAVLGNDVMNNYYYAMHITDKYLTLSDKPITFDTNQITDSMEFKYDKGNLMIGKVKVHQDSLRLVFDSGMVLSTQYKQKDPIYFDLILLFKDSTSLTSKVYNDIKKTYNFNIKIYTGDKLTHRATYSDSVTINSYPFKGYVQHADVTNDRYDGILNMAFIARYDIMYCNPFDRIIKLYKLKDRESLMKVIPIYEYAKGMNGVEYTEDGDSITHKDISETVKKRFK